MKTIKQVFDLIRDKGQATIKPHGMSACVIKKDSATTFELSSPGLTLKRQSQKQTSEYIAFMLREPRVKVN